MIGERRRAALTLAGITTALSVLCGWLLFDNVAALLSGLRGAAPLVRVNGGDAAMMILLPVIAGIAVLGGVAFFREGFAGGSYGRMLILGALFALPLALVAPWAYRSWAESALVARGYVRCESRGRPGRFPSATFARSPSICEVEGD